MMTRPIHLLLALPVVLCLTSALCAHQLSAEPQREQLLNGLKILLQVRNADPHVLLRLRVHSGAIFDLAGKEGTMALLGDALFPDPSVRRFITEELDGKLDVTVAHDYLEITLVGPSRDFERLVEILRNALLNPLPDEATIAQLREARRKLVRETSIAPNIIADQAALARLFGNYPLGRPIAGTADSLARITRADLLFARERFLNANNATLVIIGGVERLRAMRAVRQLLGPWRKSETRVPATFRQPDPPDPRPLIVNLPGAETAELRLAVRGLARRDRDRPAAEVLALIAQARWTAAFAPLARVAAFARHNAHLISGVFVMGAPVGPADVISALEAARKTWVELSAKPPSVEEFERARRQRLADINRPLDRPEALAALWLDQETYGVNTSDEARALASMSPADVQRVAVRLFKDAPVATAIIGDEEVLKTKASALFVP
ncbi:MAG: hypothetical protein C4334_09285 [Pyrinomonas sp.]|uniref:M16 family metallopeptidase n=1 Tax=Pyrinomonas sp. TaxID=2080306 RepID=UPI00332FCE56